METNRIILNEHLLPGITKVLLIGQDFPLLNFEPQKLQRTPNLSLQSLNQASCVFVYEDTPEGRDKNGTLKLLGTLPEQTGPTQHNFQVLRKEFLKKVFTYYILENKLTAEEE